MMIHFGMGRTSACSVVESYSLVQRLAKPPYAPKGYVPTSGNFNGYGSLGTLVPPPKGVALGGQFQTIVGCNDCQGGALRYASYLQSWADEPAGLERVVARA